jgi:hypothetical protein
VVPRWYYGGEDSNCNGKLDIDLSRGISEDVNGSLPPRREQEISWNFELSGTLKYRAKDLTCPSNGTYANVMFWNNLAKQTAQQIYGRGRYHAQGTYSCQIKLPMLDDLTVTYSTGGAVCGMAVGGNV